MIKDHAKALKWTIKASRVREISVLNDAERSKVEQEKERRKSGGKIEAVARHVLLACGPSITACSRRQVNTGVDGEAT